MVRHSFRTRFLSTVISTKIMLDETWDEIHEVLARDCYDLFWDGLTVPWWHIGLKRLCYLKGNTFVWLSSVWDCNCTFPICLIRSMAKHYFSLAAASRGIGSTFERLWNWNRVFVRRGFATTGILLSLDKSSRKFLFTTLTWFSLYWWGCELFLCASSVRVRKFQEWWKFGSNLRSWNGQLVDPWKTDEPPTPLRTIPGVESPLLIRTDPAHTWPIGVGKEFAASTIFLLCHLDVWPANNMPDKLLGAWEHFQSWRYRTKHTCKLHEFTYKTFKVQSSTGYSFVFYWGQMFLHVGHGNLKLSFWVPQSAKASAVPSSWRLWQWLHRRLQVVGIRSWWSCDAACFPCGLVRYWHIFFLSGLGCFWPGISFCLLSLQAVNQGSFWHWPLGAH